MSELRLYAIAVDEVRGVFGAPPDRAADLREIAAQALAPTRGRTRLGDKLGPLFRRPPTAPVLSPTEPEPADLELLLTGAAVPPERRAAAWRLLEVLVAGLAWGSTRLSLDGESLDDVDVALVGVGVPAALGLRALLATPTGFPLPPRAGLTVGWHGHETARAMASAYHSRIARLPAGPQQLAAALSAWLDGFGPWAQAATASGRPAPDLVAFWSEERQVTRA